MSGQAQIGRLALREEGNIWSAYYADNDTMDGAVFLGSIRLAAVQDPARKKAFMDMMREMVSDVIEEKFGKRPTWGGPKDAPQHERWGGP